VAADRKRELNQYPYWTGLAPRWKLALEGHFKILNLKFIFAVLSSKTRNWISRTT
jgi:hypothetical protein